MSDVKKDVTRREAVKTLGVIAALPVLGGSINAQDAAAHAAMHHPAQQAKNEKPQPLRFFTEAENRAVIELTERIIPADDSSQGAKAARVGEYIDLVVSESPDEVKRVWRDGLAAINRKSREMFGKEFADATLAQQVELLTEISRNEKSPATVEERFFRTVKYATVDGYYTSKIGIHDELRYKGNSYLKEFTGCTHPEHQK